MFSSFTFNNEFSSIFLGLPLPLQASLAVVFLALFSLNSHAAAHVLSSFSLVLYYLLLLGVDCKDVLCCVVRQHCSAVVVGLRMTQKAKSVLVSAHPVSHLCVFCYLVSCNKMTLMLSLLAV